MIEKWAKAIQRHEGYFPGSRSYRNNNPGNFRCAKWLMQEFNAKACHDNFIVFHSFEDGWKALIGFLNYAATNKLRAYRGTMTLYDFYKVYAPSADGNYPKGYAEAVAKDMGISPNTQIQMFLENVPTPPVVVSQMLSQRDPRWRDVRLGFSQLTIGGYGCFLTCLAWMVGKTPIEVNDILRAANAFGGKDRSLIISERAAIALGLDYDGVEGNINKEPDWFPNIKEVDMSPSPGKQQHFVVRIKENNKKFILDPWDGKKKAIGFYPFVSYRRFKK